METITVAKESAQLIPFMKNHPNLWANYDTDADVLYLHFKKPNHSDNSEMTDDEIIMRYEKNELIGMTILNASRWIKI
jgi:uncharacterized protein YuzE